jgi:hypothetical protein
MNRSETWTVFLFVFFLSNAAYAGSACYPPALVRGVWMIECVDDGGEPVCYYCPSQQLTASCTKATGHCPTQ